jgi:sec-independent protein translocase protein TatC
MAKIADTVTGARVLGSRVLQSQRAANPQGQMPLMDHLRELRNRVLKAALALLAGTGLGLIPPVFNRVWPFMEHPFCSAVIRGHTGCHVLGDTLVINGILDPFMLRVKIAFFFGLIIASPIWLYQLWAFLAPGLYQRERRWTYVFIFTAVPLFVGGAGLAYLVMSRGLHYLLSLTPAGVINLPTVDTYLGYVMAMLLGFGLAFELPLALVMLNMAGILSHQTMKKWRRFMIFGVFVFAGIASPSPDPVTMLLLAVPCVILVEVSEVIIWINDRRRANRAIYAGLNDDEVAPLDDSADIGSSSGPED